MSEFCLCGLCLRAAIIGTKKDWFLFVFDHDKTFADQTFNKSEFECIKERNNKGSEQNQLTFTKFSFLAEIEGGTL